jgi:hypothetical protein
MAVFFNQQNHVYITFNSTQHFPSFISMAGNKNILACIYNLSQDFTTQSNTFLTA